MTERYDPIPLGSSKEGPTSADGLDRTALADAQETLWVAHGSGVMPDVGERAWSPHDGVTFVDASALSQTAPMEVRATTAFGPATDAPEDRAPVAPTVFRFGPGVPSAPGALDTDVAAAWRGETRRRGQWRWRGRRRLRGWLLPGVVLLAVLIYVLWPRHGTPVAVLGAQVAASSTGPACDRVVTYTGTIETNGSSGTVTYRWMRSDGTASGPFQQSVTTGENVVRVTLRWTISGHGALRATASLQILSPAQRTATATVSYSCG